MSVPEWGGIILIKATGEIVLLCRLLTDPFIRAILSSSPYLLYPGYVIPTWCHSASAYEKSTPLHSYPLHTPHPPHPINSHRNYRISNTHCLSQQRFFIVFFLIYQKFPSWELFLSMKKFVRTQFTISSATFVWRLHPIRATVYALKLAATIN